MSKTLKEFAQAIKENAETNQLKQTTALCEELIVILKQQSLNEFQDREAVRIMISLRNARYFQLLYSIGNEFIKSGHGSHTTNRLFGQALIEEKRYDLALFILSNIIQQTENLNDDRAIEENAQAYGLIGRTYKQLFVEATTDINASAVNTDLARDYLEKAILAYKKGYDSQSKDRLWYGINLLTLLFRAQKEGFTVAVENIATPDEFARQIIQKVDDTDIYGISPASAWDYATAAEACIAISNWEEALKWIQKYIAHTNATVFALKGTIRQCEEIWHLHKIPQASAVYDLLRSAYEQKKIQSGEEKNEIKKDIKESSLEGNYGTDTYQTLEWYEKGLKRCNAVARVGEQASKGAGTGFLIKGSVLSGKLTNDYVLVTNAHVITNDSKVIQNPPPDTKPLLPEEVYVVFEKVDSKEVFPANTANTVYWSSSPDKLDTTIMQFNDEDQQRINQIGSKSEPFLISKNLPFTIDTERIYIIGHPEGATLSLSLQDNTYRGADGPLVHYSTPTAKGSSGSPVFNKSWNLIGVHHKALYSKKVNEGIWIKCIIEALKEEGK